MKIYSTFFLLVLLQFSLISCKSDTETAVEKIVDRNAIVDSTIFAFQQAILKSYIDSAFAKTDFNGSVSIRQHDQILYERENGFENFTDGTKLNKNSVFAIGSLSKQFTAVIVLLLEEQGKLSVEDKVSKYLDEFQTTTFENITIKELLNHTSGISDFGNGLLSKPGEDFHYSNKGFSYLGKIIEKVSGKPFEENAKNLFESAGMKNSSTALDFNAIHFASAYIGGSKNFQEVQNMPKRLASYSISLPAGGILSTVNDLHQWNSQLYGGKILKPQSLKKFSEKSAERSHYILGKMGYGFGIMMTMGEPAAFFHTGYVKGSPSLVVYYPESRASVVILSNIANEALGKNSIFQFHKEVKSIVDESQVSTRLTRKAMLKSEFAKVR